MSAGKCHRIANIIYIITLLELGNCCCEAKMMHFVYLQIPIYYYINRPLSQNAYWFLRCYKILRFNKLLVSLIKVN
jgi:hypothetical protein